ncbi:MAG: hypothetical protein WD278_10805 [Pirellulales bacterium]
MQQILADAASAVRLIAPNLLIFDTLPFSGIQLAVNPGHGGLLAGRNDALEP